MMRYFTILASVLAVCSMSIRAQQADALLRKVSGALEAGREEYVAELFRQAVDTDVKQAELFYWTRIPKGTAVAYRLAKELAAKYREDRDYDKAYSFYQESLQIRQDEVPLLSACAEVQLMRGEEKDAKQLYEKVVAKEADNLQANIFLGNYYYLQAEQEHRRLDEEYKQIVSPTRMQYARYRDRLSSLFANGYVPARECLQRVMRRFSSSEAATILERIRQLEAELK